MFGGHFQSYGNPLTNTFDHNGGEMGISLHDLKVIGVLPILSAPYEEFISTNERLLFSKDDIAELEYQTNIQEYKSNSSSPYLHALLCIRRK